MPKPVTRLSSRVLHVEFDAHIPRTTSNINRKALEDKVRDAVKAAVAELRDLDVPVAKTTWRYRYFYRASVGEGGGTLVKKVRRVVKRGAA